MADTEARPEPPGSAGYETRDVRVRPVTIFGIGLFAMTAVSFVIAWLTFRVLDWQAERTDAPLPPMAVAHQADRPPEPRLVIDEPRYVAGVRQDAAEVLDGYAWVDKPAGVVRIPIERAIDLVAQEGLPARAARRSEDHHP